MAQKPIALIVGLGNPGDEYRNTRHNVGFDFLDRLAQAKGARFSHQAKFFGETARISTPAGDVWLLKPSTYMNLSGQAVQPLAAYYKISPEEILVVHDELDLVPGTMRLKFGGSNAGHNGHHAASFDGRLLATARRHWSPAQALSGHGCGRLGAWARHSRAERRNLEVS